MRAIRDILPRRLAPLRRAGVVAALSDRLRKSADEDAGTVLSDLGTGPTGLTSEEADRRLAQHGPNAVAEDEGRGRMAILGRALLNPLVVLLAVLAAASVLTGDLRAAFVMALMVVLGVSLRFVQEARADSAAKRLRAMI